MTTAQSIFFIGMFIFFIATIFANGLISEKEQSKKRLNEYFDARGEEGEAARKLMREAGYPV